MELTGKERPHWANALGLVLNEIEAAGKRGGSQWYFFLDWSTSLWGWTESPGDDS